jgi:hypothetical protein
MFQVLHRDVRAAVHVQKCGCRLNLFFCAGRRSGRTPKADRDATLDPFSIQAGSDVISVRGGKAQRIATSYPRPVRRHHELQTSPAGCRDWHGGAACSVGGRRASVLCGVVQPAVDLSAGAYQRPGGYRQKKLRRYLCSGGRGMHRDEVSEFQLCVRTRARLL